MFGVLTEDLKVLLSLHYDKSRVASLYSERRVRTAQWQFARPEAG